MSEKEIVAGILGIGNLLLRDEGFGVHVIEKLEQGYILPESVRLMDGGTAGIYMAPFLEEVDRLIVVDVVGMDSPPGTIHRFTGDQLMGANVQMSMSPHQLGLLEILEICKLRGHEPKEVLFIGVVPAEIETKIGLSPILAGRVNEVVDMVMAALDSAGVKIEKRSTPLQSSLTGIQA